MKRIAFMKEGADEVIQVRSSNIRYYSKNVWAIKYLLHTLVCISYSTLEAIVDRPFTSYG
jgi:hypothetical protein